MKDLKQPPHSLEAEQCVLGSMLLDQEAIDTASEILTDEDFYYVNHREVFCAIMDLHSNNKPCDPITVSEYLQDKQSEVTLGFIGDLAQNTPSTANIKAYSLIVQEKSLLRALLKSSNKIMDYAFKPDGMKIEDIITLCEDAVLSVSQKNLRTMSNYVTKADALKELIRHIEKSGQSKDGITGIPTGFIDLDRKTAGLQPADLVIVAGRPSMGKTTFALNIGSHISESQQYPVVVFSLEMPTYLLQMKELSAAAGVDFNLIKTGQISKNQDAFQKFVSALDKQKRYDNIIYCDEGGISPAYMKSQCNKIFKERGGISAIIVDYLQLMTIPGKNENRTLEVSEISRQLKGIAKHFNVPVIALSQLNRGLEQRSDKRPKMADLRESGAIEQDADLILFVYRDEVYNPENPDLKGRAEILIGKQRNGPLGTIHLGFQGHFSRFTNLVGEDYGYDY